MIEIDKIYFGDCKEYLKSIPDESVELVVTDCPYHIVGGGCSNGAYGNETHEPSGIFNRRKNRNGTTNGKSVGMGGIGDQSVIDNARSGKLFDYNDIEFNEWLPDVYRVLKQGTHCYIMVNARNLCRLQSEAESTGFIFQQLLCWKKNNSTPNRYYLNQLEFILMLRKGAAKDINDMGMSNVLSVPNILGNKVHPTEKPISLMRTLIEQSSNKGDLVLDPFMGGGSTALAAVECGRHFIGSEIDEKYYKIATERLKNQTIQKSIFD